MLKKLLSRKLLAAVVTAVAKVLYPNLPDEVIVLAGTYIIGQAAVDTATAAKK